MFDSIASGLVAVFDVICNLITLIIMASIIISWVGADPHNQIVQTIRSISEPIYRPVRKITSRLPGPVDWSPFVIILIIIFAQKVVRKASMTYGW